MHLVAFVNTYIMQVSWFANYYKIVILLELEGQKVKLWVLLAKLNVTLFVCLNVYTPANLSAFNSLYIFTSDKIK